METQAEKDNVSVGVTIPAKVERRGLVGKRGSVYDGVCGPCEASGASRAEARANLTAEVVAFVEGFESPAVMWSLDGRECWIAFPNGAGACWSYAITDAERHPYWRGAPDIVYGTSGGYASRAECIGRMRSHWYDLNAGKIVRGIVGLCTDRRQWVCKHCNCVTEGGAPYRCGAPHCGKDAPVFDW
jgi:hypothetical protein